MTTKAKIFLAHASEDKEQVRNLYAKLAERGFKPWLDEVDLLPGQNWQVEISRSIRESDIFIACLSQASVKKHGYVQREFRSALATYAEKPPGSIYLIPLKLATTGNSRPSVSQLGIGLRTSMARLLEARRLRASRRGDRSVAPAFRPDAGSRRGRRRFFLKPESRADKAIAAAPASGKLARPIAAGAAGASVSSCCSSA